MQCPGQDSRCWGSDAIFDVACLQCGHEVEFFKDEPTRTCKNCGLKIVNPKMDFGCASYCQFADQCVGDQTHWPRHQEEEGPPIAREILARLKAPKELVEEVCGIIGHHHHPRPEETVNFKVVYDADQIVNLEEKQEEAPMDRRSLTALIDRAFLTEGGRELARSVFLNVQP